MSLRGAFLATKQSFKKIATSPTAPRNDTFPYFYIILTVIIICNSILTYQRNFVWKDGITLWDDVVQKSPQKARGYNNRGLVYASRGEFSQAMDDFNKAIELNPGYAEAYNNRGFVYGSQNNFIQAEINFDKALALNPKYTDAYNNRSFNNLQLKKYGKAWK